MERIRRRITDILPGSTGAWVMVLVTIFLELCLIFLLLALDVLPGLYLGIAAVVMGGIDVLILFLFSGKKKKKGKQIAAWVVSGIMLVVMGAGIFYLYNTLDTLSKISGGGSSDYDGEPFNLLVSGIDSREDISDDFARSDVNMIVTVNPQTKTILLTSMPRDSYVPLHMNGEMDKLTHTGVYGIDETINTIQDWLNVKIDYYARVDFNMFVNLVDAVGGVRVYNDQDFYSHPKGWHYTKGWHNMEGRYALWFVRERKSFEDKDEKRIRNQQKVVKALIKKITSSKTLMMNYTDILGAVEANMETDMSRSEISGLARMQIADMSPWTIKQQCVDGEDAEMGTWSMGPNRPLFVSIPDEESVKKVTTTINRTLNPGEED